MAHFTTRQQKQQKAMRSANVTISEAAREREKGRIGAHGARGSESPGLAHFSLGWKKQRGRKMIQQGTTVWSAQFELSIDNIWSSLSTYLWFQIHFFWQEGLWYNRNWCNGIWCSGIWYNRIWHNGIRYNGNQYNLNRETTITESDITEFGITWNWKLL